MTDDRADIAHLLRRSGFGATGAEIDAAARLGYDGVVGRVVAPPADPGAAGTPPPELGPEPARPARDAGAAARKADNQHRREQVATATLWWLRRMVAAREPAAEKLTFLWHGHWATSAQKVRSGQLMLAQNETMRRRGRGDFRELARTMVRDPALLIWLDAQKNKKSSPNENLARELMELFTLGHGNYSEADVRQAARALTGWRVDRAAGRAVLVPKQHDDGSKTVLGRTADLDDLGLVDLLVGQPASARFLVARLWQRLATTGPPSAAATARLVAAYGPGRDVTALLRALFTDPDFTAPAARHALVRSPVEYVVGTLRALRLSVPDAPGKDATALLGTLRGLGQVPFAPPSVGGWPAGVAWLSTAATSARIGFARRVAGAADLDALTAAAQRDRPDAAGRLLGVDAWTARTRAVLAAAAADPERLLTLALLAPENVTC